MRPSPGARPSIAPDKGQSQGSSSKAWKQPALSWSNGAGRSSAGAISWGTAAHGDIPINLFPMGLALVPPLLQLSPQQGCLGFPLGREGSFFSFLH